MYGRKSNKAGHSSRNMSKERDTGDSIGLNVNKDGVTKHRSKTQVSAEPHNKGSSSHKSDSRHRSSRPHKPSISGSSTDKALKDISDQLSKLASAVGHITPTVSELKAFHDECLNVTDRAEEHDVSEGELLDSEGEETNSMEPPCKKAKMSATETPDTDLDLL